MSTLSDFSVSLESGRSSPLADLSAKSEDRLVKAINKTADRARTKADRGIREQIAFPANYLAPSGKRLVVASYARKGELEATITARMRPTMLARFMTRGTVNRTGVTVQVSAGRSKSLEKAFVISLPAGRGGAEVETKSNLAIAVRLKAGDPLRNKKSVQQIKGNLYILYGPSVSQVFNTVREDIAPAVLDDLGNEYTRLMGVDL